MCLRKGYIVEFCISAKKPILALSRNKQHKNQQVSSKETQN
jgi:hypothetical protein